MYEFLRAEVLNSIGWQYKAIIGEATVISALLALGITGLKPLLAAISPALVALSGLWMVEQTRMMRAGDFLQLLEHAMNSEVGRPVMFWENWLRRAKPEVKWHDPHRIHHISQYIAVQGVFYLVGFFSLYESWTSKLIPWLLCLFFGALLVVLLGVTFRIIIHSRRYPIREFEEFLNWYNGVLKEFKEFWAEVS